MRPMKSFKNSYLVKWENDEVIFSRPLYVRIVAAVCAVLLASLPTGLVWVVATGQAGPNKPDLTTLVMLLLVSVVLVTGPFYLLYVAGPCSLLVNLRNRTYRSQEGFPLLARVTEGPLEDITGLYSKSIKAGHCIFLKWKKPRRLDRLLGATDFSLGEVATEDEAQAQTMQIADKLGVPPSRFGSIVPRGTDREKSEPSPWHHLHDQQ